MTLDMYKLCQLLLEFEPDHRTLRETTEIRAVSPLQYAGGAFFPDTVYLVEDRAGLRLLSGEAECYLVCCFPCPEPSEPPLPAGCQAIFLNRPAPPEQVYAVLAAAVRASGQTASIVRKLFEALNHAATLQKLLLIAFEYLQNSIDVFDAGFKRLAAVQGAGSEGRIVSGTDLDMETMKLVNLNHNHDMVKQSGKPVLIKNKFLEHDRIVCMIHPERDIGHFVVVEDSRPFTPLDFEYAAILRDALAQLFARDEFSRNAKGLHGEYFIKDLLDGRYEPGAAPRHRLDGLTRAFQPRLFCLAVEAARTPYPLLLDGIRTGLEAILPAAAVLIYQGQIVAVLSGCPHLSLPNETIGKLSAYCRTNGLYCGLSNAFPDILSLHAHYKQALRAVALGAERTGSAGLFRYADYAPDHLIAQFARHEDPRDFCHPIMRALLDHDRKNGKNLAETLYAYLLFGTAARTSAALHIHRNTLLYRLNLMNDLLEIDYTDANLRLYLILSYQMEQFRRRQPRRAEDPDD